MKVNLSATGQRANKIVEAGRRQNGKKLKEWSIKRNLNHDFWISMSKTGSFINVRWVTRKLEMRLRELDVNINGSMSLQKAKHVTCTKYVQCLYLYFTIVINHDTRVQTKVNQITNKIKNKKGWWVAYRQSRSFWSSARVPTRSYKKEYVHDNQHRSSAFYGAFIRPYRPVKDKAIRYQKQWFAKASRVAGEGLGGRGRILSIKESADMKISRNVAQS